MADWPTTGQIHRNRNPERLFSTRLTLRGNRENRLVDPFTVVYQPLVGAEWIRIANILIRRHAESIRSVLVAGKTAEFDS